MELGLVGLCGVHAQGHVAMALNRVRMRRMNEILDQLSLSIGYRNCSGQYNGGYPCLGSTIEYRTCATNIICPSEYSDRHFRYF